MPLRRLQIEEYKYNGILRPQQKGTGKFSHNNGE